MEYDECRSPENGTLTIYLTPTANQNISFNIINIIYFNAIQIITWNECR